MSVLWLCASRAGRRLTRSWSRAQGARAGAHGRRARAARGAVRRLPAVQAGRVPRAARRPVRIRLAADARADRQVRSRGHVRRHRARLRPGRPPGEPAGRGECPHVGGPAPHVRERGRSRAGGVLHGRRVAVRSRRVLVASGARLHPAARVLRERPGRSGLWRLLRPAPRSTAGRSCCHGDAGGGWSRQRPQRVRPGRLAARRGVRLRGARGGRAAAGARVRHAPRGGHGRRRAAGVPGGRAAGAARARACVRAASTDTGSARCTVRGMPGSVRPSSGGARRSSARRTPPSAFFRSTCAARSAAWRSTMCRRSAFRCQKRAMPNFLQTFSSATRTRTHMPPAALMQTRSTTRTGCPWRRRDANRHVTSHAAYQTDPYTHKNLLAAHDIVMAKDVSFS